MYARVTTVQLNLDTVNATANAAQGDNPITREAGFMGNMTLIDRQGGTGMVVGLWDTLEHLEATDAMHRAGLDRMARGGIFASSPQVTTFEVVQKADPH